MRKVKKYLVVDEDLQPVGYIPIDEWTDKLLCEQGYFDICVPTHAVSFITTECSVTDIEPGKVVRIKVKPILTVSVEDGETMRQARTTGQLQ